MGISKAGAVVAGTIPILSGGLSGKATFLAITKAESVSI